MRSCSSKWASLAANAAARVINCRSASSGAEENRVKVAEFQAKQRVTTAEGEAQQARARASGDADALRFRAQAEKEAATLQGQGSAARYRSEIEGAGGFDNYINVLNAQARLRWDGVAPRFMMGGEKGAANFLMSLPESETRAAVTAPATVPTTGQPVAVPKR